MPQVCHAVDRMGDTRFIFECATAVRVCRPTARAVHVRHPVPVSVYVCRRMEKLRHLASVRLTCMCRVFGRFVMLLNICIAHNDVAYTSVVEISATPSRFDCNDTICPHSCWINTTDVMLVELSWIQRTI